MKKENRYLPSKHMTISEFLMSYNTTSWYMIDTLPRKMWTDLDIPISLMCGGFLQKLQVSKLIFDYLVDQILKSLFIQQIKYFFKKVDADVLLHIFFK